MLKSRVTHADSMRELVNDVQGRALAVVPLFLYVPEVVRGSGWGGVLAGTRERWLWTYPSQKWFNQSLSLPAPSVKGQTRRRLSSPWRSSSFVVSGVPLSIQTCVELIDAHARALEIGGGWGVSVATKGGTSLGGAAHIAAVSFFNSWHSSTTRRCHLIFSRARFEPAPPPPPRVSSATLENVVRTMS